MSNAFKGLLLSWYVNIRSNLVVKSFKDLVNKRLIQVYHDSWFEYLKKQLNSTLEPSEIWLSIKRISQRSTLYMKAVKYLTDHWELVKQF